MEVIMKKIMSFLALTALIFTNSFCDQLKEYKEAIDSFKLGTFKELLKEKHKVFLNQNNECQFAYHTFQGYFAKSINDELVLRYCDDFGRLDLLISQCSHRADKRIHELQKPESVEEKISKYMVPLAYMGLGSLFCLYNLNGLRNYSIDSLKRPLFYFACGATLLKYGYSLFDFCRNSQTEELASLKKGKCNLKEMDEVLKLAQGAFVRHIGSMASNYQTQLPDGVSRALKALSAKGLA
jgi:hypothetical protein